MWGTPEWWFQTALEGVQAIRQPVPAAASLHPISQANQQQLNIYRQEKGPGQSSTSHLPSQADFCHPTPWSRVIDEQVSYLGMCKFDLL